ncbi:MAG: hypothetical protein U1F26_10880 [Lysobacterales bacterium]
MTQPVTEAFSKRGLVMKPEVTDGTDSVPTALANGINLYDGSSTIEGDIVDMSQDLPYFSHDDFLVTNTRSIIEGTAYLYPPSSPGASGSTGDPECAVLLLPAGMASVKDSVAKETQLNPISTSLPSASAYWWHVDHKVKALGSRVVVSELKMEIGMRPSIRCRVQGNYVRPSKQTIPSITRPAETKFLSQPENSTSFLSANGDAEVELWGALLSVNFGSELELEPWTSKKFQGIGGRRGEFTLRCARADLDDINPWEAWELSQVFTARYRTYVSASPGPYVEIGIRGKITAAKMIEIKKKLAWEITGRCLPSSAGGDEFYILFGDDTP